MLRVLVSGEGTLATRGTIVDGRLVPTSFTSSTTQEDEKAEVKMTLDGGAVKDLSAETTSSASDRIALTEEHRKGIVDPMTALLVTVAGTGDEGCSTKSRSRAGPFSFLRPKRMSPSPI